MGFQHWHQHCLHWYSNSLRAMLGSPSDKIPRKNQNARLLLMLSRRGHMESDRHLASTNKKRRTTTQEAQAIKCCWWSLSRYLAKLSSNEMLLLFFMQV